MVATYELRIYGRVQHVGFRDRIEDIGRGLGIDGVVYNYEDDTVRILANFDDEETKEMFKNNIKFLEKRDKLIIIERIEEKELNTYIEFPKGMNRISSDDLLELNKKLDEGVRYIKMIFGVLEEVKNGQNELLMSQRELINGQNELLISQKELLKGQNELLKGQRELLKGQNELIKGQRELLKGQNELIKGQNELLKGQNELIKGQNEMKDILKEILKELKRR